MVPELHALRMVCLLKVVTRVGYEYVSIFVSNRPHSSFSFVWDITRQGQISFIRRARASGPAFLKQTLLRSCWTDNVSFMYIP